MNFIYPQTDYDPQLVSTAALIGAITGQLSFGFIADITGILSLSLKNCPVKWCGVVWCGGQHSSHLLGVLCSESACGAV